MITRLLLSTALVTAVFVAACGSSESDSTPSPEPTGSASASPTSSPTGTRSPTPTASSTSTATPTTGAGFPVDVFFSRHPASDDDPSAVFPVDRVAPDAGVARFVIGELLEGPTVEEAAVGYFSTWTGFGYSDESDCSGERFEIAIEEGIATVRFCVTVTLLGVVADGQAQSTLTSTLEQFSTIDRVVILNREGRCMFDLSGMDLCLQ